MAEEKFNLDELVAPSFMTEAYIVDILRQAEDDPELHLINYVIKPGSSAGDHYASIMFKIIATYGSKGKIVSDRRFIFKTVPEAEGQKKDLLEQLPAFKNEILMYTKILPEMDKILKEHGEKGWWPKLVYSQEKPFVLMFDDLTVENYQVVYDQLDYQQIEMVVDKIAKYHALGMVLVENGLTEIKNLKMTFTEEMRGMFQPMMRVIYQLTAVARTWTGYAEIADKIDAYIPKMADRMFKILRRDYSNDFNVLNHGDFHIRNLMFKKTDQGELSEVLFLDFQMPNYSVPAFDFIGLLTSMGDNEVRRRENDVIKMYHRILVANLKTYGFNGELPAVVDIQVTLMRLSEQHAFYSFILGPMFRLRGIELGALFDPNESAEVVKALDAVFNDPAFVEDMKLTLEKFESRGLFDA